MRLPIPVRTLRPRTDPETEHQRKVERIAAQLRARRSARPISLRKRAVSHQVPKARDLKYSDDQLDVSDLNAVLRIDPVRRICVAESGVTFVDLVAATMKHGLVPLVVPELKTITVGGAVSGCSLESMSFQCGGFHDTCLEYEVVTARGDLLTCTADNQHRLIFQMMHGAFGTVGVLTRLTFKLVPAAPYVKIVYERYRTLQDYQDAISRHHERRDIDFMDGMIHSMTDYVLCTARFVHEAPYLNRYDWMKVYYQSTKERTEDYLKTPDYFFRYDHGVTNVHPKSLIGRFLFGRFMGSAQLLRLAEKLHWLLPSQRPTVTLDVFLPFSKAGAFLDWYSKEFGFFPLWCVPYKRVRDYEWLSKRFYEGNDDQLFLDFAIYGLKQEGDKNYYKMIEDKLLELGGMKTLISHNYYSEQDFWRTWNKDNYDRVKAITDPDNIFRDLYSKTCRAAMGVEA